VAAGKLNPDYVPNLKLTSPVFNIGPHKSWSDPKKISSIDPFGHLITDVYGGYLDKGFDIRPTIAVTKAHIDLPETREAVQKGRLVPDGKILLPSGQSIVSKAAIEPVWYLPEIARRFGCTETVLRQSIFRMTNGMYPELITRPDIKIFLPPIGGLTIYIWGDPDTIPDEDIELTCRVHDECNGSDVFGSDICTCRPYLTHAIEECIKTAQRGGAGIVIYYRKEGRSLGEVTKYLVYNTRKRQEGGDSAENYFACTEKVAGVQDTRFQALMPDPLHFLGVTKIHNFISMSDMKYNAIVSTGIEIVNRVEIPKELVPDDAQVEITAKVFHGYNAGKAYQGIDEKELKKTVGREYDYDGKAGKQKDANVIE
jgi:GTP cyclohydrolase II